MPAARRSAPKEAKSNGRLDERAERLGSGIDEDRMTRRSSAFGKALNRKGLPMTWGCGVLRTDDAFKRDEQYRREDAGL